MTQSKERDMEKPAFPDCYQDSMTLRDWFAGRAISGVAKYLWQTTADVEEVAALCYRFADAMLAARDPDKEREMSERDVEGLTTGYEEARIQTSEHLAFRIRACLNGVADPRRVNAFCALDALWSRASDTLTAENATLRAEVARLRAERDEAMAMRSRMMKWKQEAEAEVARLRAELRKEQTAHRQHCANPDCMIHRALAGESTTEEPGDGARG